MCWFLLIFFIMIVTITGPALAAITVRAKFSQPVTLPCERKCSGLVQWIMESKPHDPVAWCNQTSCSSQEGFNISYDQYLNGNLNLSISAADYSKRTWYFCRCTGKDVSEVHLSVEPLNSSVHKRPGEDLLLNLSKTDPAELIYNSSKSDSSSHQICTMEESELRCNSEYEQRASLNLTVIILREVTPSDSGDYIIKDKKFKEIICIYTVTVEEEKPVEESSVSSWMIGLIVGILVLVLVLVVVRGVYWWKKKPKSNQEPKQGTDIKLKSCGSEKPGVKTEDEMEFIHQPDGAAKIRKTETNNRNGECGQKRYSSVSVKDDQSRDGSDPNLCLIQEQNSSGAATGQNCPNGNSTTETE